MGIRALVVDDSAFMRVMITDMLASDPGIEVIGTARDGLDALSKMAKLNPDVVTMDVEMPKLDGIEALKRIMAESPRPVVMLSSITTQGAEATMDALQNGAVDFMPKPQNPSDMKELASILQMKVRLAAGAKVRSIGNEVTDSSFEVQRPLEVQSPVGHRSVVGLASRAGVTQIVAMGTSTGGPQALDMVLRAIPKDIPSPIVIVQHMPPKFTQALANRLDNICRIHVVEAKNGQELQNGTAYIAPGDYHMTVAGREGSYFIALNQAEKRHEHRPSVDVLFESLAVLPNIPRHLVIMTGMGTDGAKGMKLAKQSGATTMAQSEDTCVIFGMPKAAINLGCVDTVAPLEEIGQRIVDRLHIAERSLR